MKFYVNQYKVFDMSEAFKIFITLINFIIRILLLCLCRDRLRTAINVMGDAFGAGVVHYRSQKELNGLEEKRSSVSSSHSTIEQN